MAQYSYQDFVDWFYEFSTRQALDETILLDGYLSYLTNIGFDLSRVNYAHKALHPQVSSISSIWVPKSLKRELESPINAPTVERSISEVSSGFVMTLKFPIGSFDLEGFKNSPIQLVFKSGNPYRFKIEGASKPLPYVILEDGEAIGGSDYFIVPFFFSNEPFGFLSWITKRKGGFSEDSLDFLLRTSHLISLRWNQSVQSKTMEEVLKIYLGKATGPKVFSGRILRGDFEKIQSIIWFSDIRDFTSISERLESAALVELLNAYFGICIPVIESLGGEVLKMLGDGLLAVFPFNERNKIKTHFKSLLAARRILKQLIIINKERKKSGLPVIEHGIGLHYGTVMYGNIGAKDRLDFTVIGTAVNLSSRIASLCGQYRKVVLASEEFAKEIDIQWEDLGEQTLKGVARKQRIFGIPQAEAMRDNS